MYNEYNSQTLRHKMTLDSLICFRNVQYPFIATTLRFILSKGISACEGLVHGSNRSASKLLILLFDRTLCKKKSL